MTSGVDSGPRKWGPNWTAISTAATASAASTQCLFRAGIVGLGRIVGLGSIVWPGRLIEIVEVALDTFVISGRNLLLQDCFAVPLLDLADQPLILLLGVSLVAESLGFYREQDLAGRDRRFRLLGFEIGLDRIIFGRFAAAPTGVPKPLAVFV